MIKKLTKTIAAIMVATMIMSTVCFAAEYTVADAQAVLYTNENTTILSDASTNATVVVPKIDAGLPILVTGITSNGYFRIQLDKEYYVAGIGLQATPNAATTAPAVTTPQPAQANGKYVCVIEPGDTTKWWRSDVTRMQGGESSRKDFTNDSLYISIRNTIEKQIAAGKKSIIYSWTSPEKYGGEHNSNVIYLRDLGNNLFIDLMKSHPEYWTPNSYTDFYTQSYLFNGYAPDNVTLNFELYK